MNHRDSWPSREPSTRITCAHVISRCTRPPRTNTHMVFGGLVGCGSRAADDGARRPSVWTSLEASSRAQFDRTNGRSSMQERHCDGCAESQVVANCTRMSRGKGHSESFQCSIKAEFISCEVFGLLLETNILMAKYEQCSNWERLQSYIGSKIAGRLAAELKLRPAIRTLD